MVSRYMASLGAVVAVTVLLFGTKFNGEAIGEEAQAESNVGADLTQPRADSSQVMAVSASDQTASQSTIADKQRYRIVGVGDIMMGSDWPQPGMDPRVTPNADPADVIGAEIKSLFAAADVTFGNFEGTIHSGSSGAKFCRDPSVCYVFRSPEFHADYLRRAGFTLISNANNHARDFGEPGREMTFANLRAAGFAVAGADQPGKRIAVQSLDDGTRVALVAFGHNPGLPSVQNLGGVRSLITQASEQADIVVVSCHIGAEGAKHDRVTRATEIFLGEDRGNPFAFARSAVDAGADAVFCHGPHVPRAIEVYKGRFIAYSLGNFWTYGRFNLGGHNGLAPIADIEVGKNGSLLSARIVSARQDRPGGPYLDASGAAARRIAELSQRDFPESGISIAADGTVSWKK
ncbi:MAG: capsule biosynthesis protein CapA [Alphaproteobacteria bacterium HGW-Alphaproteobacteria-15]|nr:MAG: capsule biosynthesis protein CapA [Alphaproteobacteria bacterium HGW-Alphaproteobacteria-15]